MLLCLFWAQFGCEAKGQELESRTVVAGHAEQKLSANYESCAKSSDCSAALRCIDSQCQVEKRSRLGDYYAAMGRRSVASGQVGEAAQFYNRAVTQYGAEQLETPGDVLCEQGMALATGQGDAQRAEAAARLLHNCILVMPPNSTLARNALDFLAGLSESGLDESLLTREKTAALYLTETTPMPDLKSLHLKVRVEGKKNRKTSLGKLVKALESDASKEAFSVCWTELWKKTKLEKLKVTLPVEYRLILDEDNASGDRVALKVGKHQTRSAELSAASQCVEEEASKIAEGEAKNMREFTSWKRNISIELSF